MYSCKHKSFQQITKRQYKCLQCNELFNCSHSKYNHVALNMQSKCFYNGLPPIRCNFCRKIINNHNDEFEDDIELFISYYDKLSLDDRISSYNLNNLIQKQVKHEITNIINSEKFKKNPIMYMDRLNTINNIRPMYFIIVIDIINNMISDKII